MLSIAAVIGVTGAIAYELINNETTGLENAHRAVGMTASCDTLQESDRTWALCDAGRSAPSVWHRHGDDWVAANGQAHKLREQLQEIGSGAYQNLPALLSEPRVDMPASVREQIQ